MSLLETVFDLNFEAYLHGPVLLAAMVGLGFVVGILTGLFGVGGAFLLTPMLNVAFGIPYQLSIGSSLSFTIGTSCSGARRHWRLKNFEPRSAVILGCTAILGAIVGATLNRSLNLSVGQYRYTLVMHSLFVAVLFLTAWLIGRRHNPGVRRKALLQRMRIPPLIDLPAADLKGVSIPGICAVGILVGLMTGMMGIGGGVVLMPLLILAIGLDPHRAVGTSLGVVMFGSIAGALKHGTDGNVNLIIVMSLLLSSVCGVQLGVWICDRLRAQRLRRYFAVMVVLVALGVAVRLFWSLL